MASCLMHIAVAKKLFDNINNKKSINYYEYILGSIAPDVSKYIGENKNYSHFITDEKGIPNLNLFLKKYKLNSSFNLGYYIHLYTDYLFYKDFLPLFYDDKDILKVTIRDLKGQTLNLNNDEAVKILYSDYTNLNTQLIDEYQLDLNIFYSQYIKPKTDIKEINTNKINVLLEQMGTIIENSTNEEEIIINITSIKSFIDNCSNEIYNNLKEKHNII